MKTIKINAQDVRVGDLLNTAVGQLKILSVQRKDGLTVAVVRNTAKPAGIGGLSSSVWPDDMAVERVLGA